MTNISFFEKGLLLFAKFVYCIEAPDEQEVSKWSYFEKVIHLVSVLFELVDLTNTILDIVFVYGLYQSGLTGMAIAMTTAIIIARFIARGGKKALLQGGITYVPFFQRNSDYVSENEEKEQVVAYIYCLTFTEVSIFFVEDATTILIWMYTGSFDPSDNWDLANSIVTLATAFSTMALLIVTILYSINCKYCKTVMDEIQSRKSLMGKFWSSACAIIQLGLKILCGIMYLLFFLLVIIGYFIFLIILNIHIISGKRGDGFQGSFSEGLVYVLLAISWLISLYFALKIVNICGCKTSLHNDTRRTEVKEFDHEDGSNSC